jgi:hypothetical protein
MAAPPAHGQLSRCRIIAALIFVLCSMLSSGRILKDASTQRRLKGATTDLALISDQRFAAAKAVLPRRGVIGYIGEGGDLARGDYYAAEYALAPLVVDDSPDHSLVLGNFPHSSVPAPPNVELENLQLIQDFGHGVALFAKKGAN